MAYVYSHGSGTINDPYLVFTADDLNGVRDHLDCHFKQMFDIDLGVPPWNEGEGWEPIGNDVRDPEPAPFTGAYDFNGFKITNLTIKKTSVILPRMSFGLFGFASNSIFPFKSPHLENVNISIDGPLYLGDETFYQFSTGALCGTINLKNDDYNNNIDLHIANGKIAGNIKSYSLVGGLIGSINIDYIADDISLTIENVDARCNITAEFTIDEDHFFNSCRIAGVIGELSIDNWDNNIQHVDFSMSKVKYTGDISLNNIILDNAISVAGIVGRLHIDGDTPQSITTIQCMSSIHALMNNVAANGSVSISGLIDEIHVDDFFSTRETNSLLIEESFSTIDVSVADCNYIVVSGLLGGFIVLYNDLSFRNCYSVGSITAANVDMFALIGLTQFFAEPSEIEHELYNCYSSFSTNIAPDENHVICGLIALIAKIENSELILSRELTNCYYNSDLNLSPPGSIIAAGLPIGEYGTPKTTEELQTIETYEEWDFEGIWGIHNKVNDGYPYLKWYPHVIPPDEPDEDYNLIFKKVLLEIKDNSDFLKATLSEDDGIKDCWVDTRLNGESSLEFRLPITSDKIREITEERQIHAGGRVYNLRREEAIDYVYDTDNSIWVQYRAVERWNELDSQLPEPYICNDPTNQNPADLSVIIVGGGSDLSNGRHQVGTAGHALYAALIGSGWSVGTVDVEGIHDIEMEKVSRLAVIKQIQHIWGGYLLWDSLNRVVHLRDPLKWSPYEGFQIYYSKNIKNFTTTKNNKIYTKLYAFGKDDLDIASVNNGKKYVENYSHSDTEYVGIYRNPDIEDPEELLELANALLSLNSKYKSTYKVNITDLRTLPGFEHEKFQVGDLVDILPPNHQDRGDVSM